MYYIVNRGENVQDKNRIREIQIEKLQKNLNSIRRIAGWTCEELGEKIGVTKQTISRLENKISPLNYTQYIAIRKILEDEILENKDNEVLAKVVTLLLDYDDEISEEEYSKVQEITNTVAASAAGGTSKDNLKMVFYVLINTITFVTPVIGMLIDKNVNWSIKKMK
jgi:transcriptional regulator with XRE-family HTH domain